MSLRKIVTIIAAVGLAASAAAASAAELPDVKAQSAYVMDADTGDTLYVKNPDVQGYPGSTTKIMTCIIALEKGKNKMDQAVVISDDSLRMDSDVSVLGLQPGDQVTLRNALTGMMLVSGCDAAVDIAETVMPTEADFVAAMNEKAGAVGANRTHFTNPHGLPDENHYTTARDLAQIAAYGMKMEEFRNIVSKSEFDMPYITGGYKHCISTNEFLTGGFPGANGVKTGTTNAGGPCLVVSATQNGRTVIAAIVNSEDRYGDAQELMAYGFSVLKPSENVYVIRKAPAGQKLSSPSSRAAGAGENNRDSKTSA